MCDKKTTWRTFTRRKVEAKFQWCTATEATTAECPRWREFVRDRAKALSRLQCPVADTLVARRTVQRGGCDAEGALARRAEKKKLPLLTLHMRNAPKHDDEKETKTQENKPEEACHRTKFQLIFHTWMSKRQKCANVRFSQQSQSQSHSTACPCSSSRPAPSLIPALPTFTCRDTKSS